MLSLFRTNQIAFNLLLIVYILLVRSSAFFVAAPEEAYSGQGVLSNWFQGYFGTSGGAAVLAGIIIVFIQSLLINIICAKFRLAISVSLLPGLFYALLVSMIPEFLALSPALLANTFFILALWELFESYRKTDVAGHIVNIGFWVGVASLFYFSEVIFLLLAIIGLIVLRAFRVKEVLMLLIGFLVPYIFSAVYFFWYDHLGVFWQTHIIDNVSFFNLSLKPGLVTYINLAMIALVALIVLFGFNSYYAKKNIQVQKNITVLYWTLFFAMISIVFQANIQFYHFLIFMVPLGIFLSFKFLKMKSQKAEAFHLLLFVGILIWQFHPWWLR